MGEVTLVVYGVLAIVALAVLGFGAVRRHRFAIVLGVALLLALAGTWVVGPFGAFVGVLPLAFARGGGR